MRLPAGRRGGERVASLAQQVDVLPTLLDHLGIAIPDGVDGRPLLRGGEDAQGEEREALSETGLGGPEMWAVLTPAWKVIRSMGPRETRFEVYDVRKDPAEKNDLVGTAPILLGYGRQVLAQWTASAPRQRYSPEAGPSGPRIDRETRERLKALGYVN
jgi:arylsulfatase A-like enzyme